MWVRVALVAVCAVYVVVGFNTELHIIEHTHDDVGWDNTIDGYYVDGLITSLHPPVRKILDEAVAGLLADPKRRYTYVEIAFFSMWWYEQNQTTRTAVQHLVRTGQLEFTNAGWCMSDEATSHFIDQIDQMTLGHLWLQSQLGNSVKPTVGWHIDPFGHSTATPFLFAKMGFNMFQFGRAPAGTTYKQFVWRPLYSVQSAAEQDMWTYFHNGYCGAPSADFSDPVMRLVAAEMRMGVKADCPVKMAMYGCDFALPSFGHADKEIEWLAAHPEENVTAFYSTPVTFYQAMYKCGLTWDVFQPPNNDFFPYWTGFFTSQPAFKRMVRGGSSLLHSAWISHTIARGTKSGAQWRRQAAQINVLWASMGVSQHHDSVTGTAKPKTFKDYTARIAYGTETTAEALKDITGGTLCTTAIPHCTYPHAPRSYQSHCVEMPYPQCPSVGISGSTLLLLNPLGWSRTEAISFTLPSGHYTLSDHTGAKIIHQQQSLGIDNTALTFMANLPPLGQVEYRVVKSTTVDDSTDSTTPESTVVTPEPFSFENKYLKLDFGADGRVHNVTNKVSGVHSPLDIDVLYYWGSIAGNDGAYDFHPTVGSEKPIPFPGSTTPSPPVVTRGPLYSEVRYVVDVTSNVALVVRLYNDEPSVEVQASAGPIDVTDNRGKDVIVRVTASAIQSGVTFYTDDSGMELLRRERGNGTNGQKYDVNKPGRNYYPATALATVGDDKMRMAWVADRAQGASSMAPGSLERMFDRRLLVGDGKGMDVPLDATDIINSTHWLIFDTPSRTSTAMRSLYYRKYFPPTILLQPTSNPAVPSTPLTSPLPPNVHILTLQTLVNNWTYPTPYDVPPPHHRSHNPPLGPTNTTAHPDGSVILRLHHIYASDEGGPLAKPVTVNVATLFKGGSFVDWEEVSLTANQPLAGMKRLAWSTKRTNGGDKQRRPATPEAPTVEISPMDIITLVGKWKTTTAE